MKLKPMFGAMVAVLINVAMALMPTATSAQEVRTYYVVDVTGSPVAAMDGYANRVWSEDYTPYGERRVNAINSGDNHAWVTGGPQNEDSGLVALGNRYYDPAIGRFLSLDLVGVSPDDGSNFNRYAYANNNPYRYVDPSGELPIIPIIIGVIWVADKAYAAYEAYQDVKAIQGGEQTLGAVAQRRAIEHAAGMALGPVGRWTAKAGVSHVIGDVGEGIAARGTLEANRAAGRAAEARAAKDLVAEGNTILGSQVSVRTSEGRRVIDHLIQTPSGQIVACEVKCGGAVRNASQLAKDRAMAAEGGVIIGKNAPDALRGQQVVIPTIERRY